VAEKVPESAKRPKPKPKPKQPRDGDPDLSPAEVPPPPNPFESMWHWEVGRQPRKMRDKGSTSGDDR
jgi:hypothetical protein